MGKKINQLTAAADSEAVDTVKLLAIADPVTGEARKITVAQARLALSPKAYKYTATGAEGTTITIAELANKNILAILRESGVIFEVDSAPDSAEFTFDGIDIVLGAPTNPSERFLILWCYA